MRTLAAILALAALTSCGDKADDSPVPEATEAARASPAAKAPVVKLAPSGDVTPNKDRIATIGLLNKRNNISQDLIIQSGTSRRVGNVIVKVASCERTAPWETDPEEGAFVQLYVNERPTPRAELGWRRVFSGWLFKNSPSLNVVQHPIYDVWVKACAMKYPGEDPSPAPSASASSAAKPSGSASGESADE